MRSVNEGQLLVLRSFGTETVGAKRSRGGCEHPFGASAPLSPSNETSLERYAEDFTKKD
ncbi:hypothetical protein [Nitratifractor sp.]